MITLKVATVVYFAAIVSTTSGIIRRKLSASENSNLQKLCGTRGLDAVSTWTFPSHTKMYAGTSATPFEAPWSVSVLLFSSRVCSGTLISPRHVLTAAHCVVDVRGEVPTRKKNGRVIKPELYTIVVGEKCGGPSKNCQFNRNSTFRKVLRHLFPKSYLNYNGRLRLHFDLSDVAVLELDSDLQLSNRIMPACLASARPRKQDTLTMFGYGLEFDIRRSDKKAGTLQKIKTKVVNCEGFSKNLDILCTMAKQHPCSGDSGSGGVIRRRGGIEVVSVLSGGQNCSTYKRDPYTDDYQTSVVHHSSWICKYTGVCIPNVQTLTDKYKGKIYETN